MSQVKVTITSNTSDFDIFTYLELRNFLYMTGAFGDELLIVATETSAEPSPEPMCDVCDLYWYSVPRYFSEVMEQSFRLTVTTKPLELPESMTKLEVEVVTPKAARAGAAVARRAMRCLKENMMKK